MGEQNTIRLGDILEIERQVNAAREDQTACHLRCLDAQGRELTILMSNPTAQKLASLLVHSLNTKK